MISKILTDRGYFSKQDVLLFEEEYKVRKFEKDKILLNQGEICQSVYFIQKGAFLQYNFKDEIEQNIIDLYIENDWCFNQRSFVSQKPSETFIKAYSDSTVLELNIHSLHRLIAKSPAFLQLGNVLELSSSRIHFFDNSLTPFQKYQYLLQNRRVILQVFPLKIIASYLKITPETLSRVREKLAKNIS